ncbi:TlpA disulfide reductase family protein [Lutibacter sp.]|uniref:TlpA family protein disulfide reductase n=1 Tax=Lutibacter sp. TaxID=1925666 RepID=UPI0025C30B6D|nr:TlpA disulfide reductase family protein [Lutibacter sp.]
MRNLSWIFTVLILISCKNESVDFVTLKGTVKTENLDKFKLENRTYSKEITVKEDGSFSDTLKVEEGIYIMSNGNDRVTVFLKNGYDLSLAFNGDKFSDGVSFEGVGAETNTFLDNKREFYMSEMGDPKTYFKLDKEEYEAKIAEAKATLQGFRDSTTNLDSTLKSMDLRNDQSFLGYVTSNYEKNHENLVRFAKGKKSPIFNNYENHKGGTTSLSDLKGKYVYLDIWATWCAPCKAEIPFLKQIEAEFHDKNIEFVSISVDKENAHDTWKKMVEEESLGGIQLFADNNFESEFITEYGINAIPRFILLDPQGNIVDSDAYRPSNPQLKELLLELGL